MTWLGRVNLSPSIFQKTFAQFVAAHTSPTSRWSCDNMYQSQIISDRNPLLPLTFHCPFLSVRRCGRSCEVISILSWYSFVFVVIRFVCWSIWPIVKSSSIIKYNVVFIYYWKVNLRTALSRIQSFDHWIRRDEFVRPQRGAVVGVGLPGVGRRQSEYDVDQWGWNLVVFSQTWSGRICHSTRWCVCRMFIDSRNSNTNGWNRFWSVRIDGFEHWWCQYLLTPFQLAEGTI